MRKRALAGLFVLALVLGVGMRFYGLDWGLPYHFHSDERVMAFHTEKLRTAASVAEVVSEERRFFLYPPLLMYLQIGLVAAVSLVHRFSHTDPSSLTLYYLLGRGLVALFGSLTLLLIYRLGRRLYSESVGRLAAVLLAFTVLHIRDSHFYFPDVPMTFFVVLTFLAAVGIMEGRGIRPAILTGICAGLGIATKQTALMVLPAIAAAHLLGAFRGQTLSWAAARKALGSLRFWGLLVLPFAVAGVTFLLVDPFVLAAPGRFLAMSGRTAAFVKGANQPNWTYQFTHTTIAFWFTNVLYFGMGPLLEAASLLGILWAAALGAVRTWRRRVVDAYASDVLVLAFVLPYLAFVGGGYMKFIRYAIPTLPFLCLLGARFLSDLREGARSRGLRAAAGVLTGAVILGSFLYGLAYMNIYRREDVRIQASKWIHANVPAGAAVLIDSSAATPLLGSMFFQPDFYSSYMNGLGPGAQNRTDYYRIKVLRLISEVERPRSQDWWRRYLEERLRDVDYVFMSDERPEQYSYRPDEYPALNTFYRDLFSGGLGFDLVKTFKTHPALDGLVLNDDRAELTFRLFDHPKVMIFARRKP